MKVDELMNVSVVSVKNDSTIKELLLVFADNQSNVVPVLDENGIFEGIVTEGDIFRLLSPELPNNILEFDDFFKAFKDNYLNNRLKSIVSKNVETIMTKNRLVTVFPENDVEEIVSLFSRVRFKEIPVVNDKDQLVGLISRGNVIRYIVSEGLK